jgi:hypothetical protein
MPKRKKTRNGEDASAKIPRNDPTAAFQDDNLDKIKAGKEADRSALAASWQQYTDSQPKTRRKPTVSPLVQLERLRPSRGAGPLRRQAEHTAHEDQAQTQQRGGQTPQEMQQEGQPPPPQQLLLQQRPPVVRGAQPKAYRRDQDKPRQHKIRGPGAGISLAGRVTTRSESRRRENMRKAGGDGGSQT